MAFGRFDDSAAALSGLGRIVTRVPLIISGGVRRIAEDPWRGWAAATRAAPWLLRGPRSRGRRPWSDLTEVLRGVAEDRLDDARVAAMRIEDQSDRRVAQLAIARCEGDIVDVAASRAETGQQRRQVRAARRELALWSSALPTWAARRRPPAPVEIHGRVDQVTASDSHLRVLHVVTNSLPRVQAGSTIRTHRIAAAQQERGWRVAVATRPGFPVFHGDLQARRDRHYDGVDYLSLLPRVMPPAERIFATFAELLGEAVDRWQPQVLHAASDHVNARAALEVGRRRDLPVAYEARTLPEESWLSRHGGESARGSSTFALMHRRHGEVLRAADVVTTLGEHMRTAICDQGVEPERVFVVPNAVPTSMLSPRTEPTMARTRRAIPGGDLLLGTVTTMYSYEGLETLIEATARLRHDDVDARLLLVGDGPERECWLALAEARGVPVTAPGRVPVGDVVDYLDAIDVFALPRRDDAITRWVTALKPLEAQARGIPVVGADLPAVAEVLAPSSTLVGGDDPQAWAQALARYLDPGVRTEAGEAAKEWVRACRTWPSVLEGYASAYAFVGVNPSDGAGIAGR